MRYIILTLILFITSCKEHTDSNLNVVTVEFSTYAPTSKAYGNQWSQGDEIGIFMWPSGTDFTKENTTLGANNIQHIADKTGPHCFFVPQVRAQQLLMPSDNTSMDFRAYYPFSEVVYTGLNVPIDVHNQENIEAIDYMVSQRVVGKNQNDNKVLFTFDHVMSLLEITLQGGYGTTTTELENMRAKLCNSKTYGSLSISNNSISARTYGDIITKNAGIDLKIEAIVIPQNFKENEYSFLSISHRGITYEIPLKFNFTQSKRHRLTLLVEDEKIYLSQAGVVIKDWDEGVGGNFDFEHKVVADGTKQLDKTLFTIDNPYWVINGTENGDINQNYHLTKNVREALDALPNNGSADGKIILEIKNITDLPTFNASGVEKGAFENYKQIKKVILSSSVKSLDDKSFAGCVFMQQIDAVGVTTMAESVFKNCSSLTDVDIPLLETASNYTFKGCSSLKMIHLPQLTALSVEMFSGCSILERSITPKAIKLFDRAFNDCNALAELHLNASGEIRMVVNPFSGFINSANCILILGTDKQQGCLGLPSVTSDEKWGANDKELQWKQIKFE